MNPAVVADQLSKTYRVYARPWDRLLEPLARRPLHRPFHALREISFELAGGEALGIIGENGAGKSTLLKILTGITAPSGGSFRVAGKVAAILELGSGFHPEFTGRQNIVLNAAMLGLDQAQIEARMPAIIAFSELGPFIDQPVKCYSTGMAMRLAFAIAVQVDPEILIIDEALSVGDGYFQKKCLDELRRYREGGGTLLFCSHAMYYVSAFCDGALWLRQGRVEAFGPVDETIRAYEAFLGAKSSSGVTVPASPPPAADSPARLGAVRLTVAGGPAAADETPRVRLGETLAIDVGWRCDDRARPLHLGICLNRSSDNMEVCAFGTHRDGLAPLLGSGGRARLTIPELTLVKGAFTLYIYLLDEQGLSVYDQMVLPEAFVVESSAYHFGVVTMDHAWEGVEPMPSALEAGERQAVGL